MDLVTGGAGFIGSHLVEALIARGRAVRVLDDLSTGSLANLASVGAKVEMIQGDILDLDVLRAAMRGVHVVFHEAAIRSVPRSVEDPALTNRVNVEGTLNVLMTAREVGVRRVVSASSSSVYGEADRLPLDESAPPRPVSPYAVSKLAGEHYCRVFACLHGLSTVSLRYFNVFGPRQDPASPYAAVVPRFIQAALAGVPLEIHGDGRQSRDFTHVRDVVAANCLAAEAPGLAGEVINVAGGRSHSLMDIVEWLSRRLGHHGGTLRWVHTAPRPGDVRDTLAALDRARTRLGYRPSMRFEAGLEDAFQYLAAMEPARR
ncbi:MAG TPA: NAD-dependent epimerase/dehydratase family protein [Candidatus Tectomicrobia bacterium]|nr:NAD-dependent epimerase/dehydratase family protein [Candidatus Tectomicrobia bacterium]